MSGHQNNAKRNDNRSAAGWKNGNIDSENQKTLPRIWAMMFDVRCDNEIYGYNEIAPAILYIVAVLERREERNKRKAATAEKLATLWCIVTDVRWDTSARVYSRPPLSPADPSGTRSPSGRPIQCCAIAVRFICKATLARSGAWLYKHI